MPDNDVLPAPREVPAKKQALLGLALEPILDYAASVLNFPLLKYLVIATFSFDPLTCMGIGIYLGGAGATLGFFLSVHLGFARASRRVNQGDDIAQRFVVLAK